MFIERGEKIGARKVVFKKKLIKGLHGVSLYSLCPHERKRELKLKQSTFQLDIGSVAVPQRR